MASTRYKCLDCGEVVSSAAKICPKCGSDRMSILIERVLTLRTELRGSVKEQSGRVTSIFLKRQKLSRHGKEATEELHIDISGNRKFHHVTEKDEKGNWKVVHHEDEPLKKKRARYGCTNAKHFFIVIRFFSAKLH
jgi:DNA-directed RNA polymerase subunit RPC12/RpoP